MDRYVERKRLLYPDAHKLVSSLRVACAGVGYPGARRDRFGSATFDWKIPDRVVFDEAAFTTVCAVNAGKRQE